MVKVRSAPVAMPDPRREPGAYITSHSRLFEVIKDERTSLGVGRLHVRNCQTLHPLWLTAEEVDASDLVRAAPAVVVPDLSPEEIS